MEDNVFVNMTNLTNCIILAMNLWLVIYNYRKCYIIPIPKKDHVFYLLKLKKSSIYLIINGIAVYYDFRVFYDLHIGYPNDLVFIRYLLRAVSFIYLIFKILDATSYYPTAYDKR